MPIPSRRVLLGLAAVACAAAVASWLIFRPNAPVALPPATVARLTAIAADAARANGDAHPDQVMVVRSTRARALTSATPGDFVASGGNAVSYLITMHGTFTANDVSRPLGARAPTGHYLSLVVDARTFGVTDFGLSPGAPAVPPASLGPVTYLAVRG